MYQETLFSPPRRTKIRRSSTDASRSHSVTSAQSMGHRITRRRHGRFMMGLASCLRLRLILSVVTSSGVTMSTVRVILSVFKVKSMSGNASSQNAPQQCQTPAKDLKSTDSLVACQPTKSRGQIRKRSLMRSSLPCWQSTLLRMAT